MKSFLQREQWFLVLALLILHLLLLSRLNFTAWPEMLSYPYLFSRGLGFYKDFIMPYPPGLPLILSIIFGIFGYSVTVLKLLTWIIILSTDVLIFIVLRKISSELFSSIFFLGIFIVIQSVLDGNMLWFDISTVIPLLLSFYFFVDWIGKKQRKDLFLTGVSLSLAILLKQLSLIYLFSILFLYLYIKRQNFSTSKRLFMEELALLFGGTTLFITTLIIYLLANNSLLDFWNWTVNYPLKFWSKFPGYVDFSLSRMDNLTLGVLAIPITFVILLIKHQTLVNRQRGLTLLSSLVFLLSALITVYPRFSFFHLQPAIAFFPIALSQIHFNLRIKLRKLLLGAITLSCAVVLIVNLRVSRLSETRFYDSNVQNIAKLINDLTSDNDRVFLLGLESSEYVFSRRIPPPHWADNFGWYLEIPGVQKWVLLGMRQNPPKIVLWKLPQRGRWFDLGTYQPKQIVRFIRENYSYTKEVTPGVELWIRKN